MPAFTSEAMVDTVDHLVTLTLESDREVAAALIKCRETLRAITWERFRLRHEEASRQRAAARRRAAFIARHKAYDHA
jgi:hypothetical protein